PHTRATGAAAPSSAAVAAAPSRRPPRALPLGEPQLHLAAGGADEHLHLEHPFPQFRPLAEQHLPAPGRAADAERLAPECRQLARTPEAPSVFRHVPILPVRQSTAAAFCRAPSSLKIGRASW